jgi:O-antigen/teichoic acid export membrane protein
MAEPSRPSRQLLVFRGLAWTTLYRLFETLASFAGMLVVVRILSPSDYGRAGAIVAILVVVNAFSCSHFMSQGLQLGDDAEPDWRLHWSAGLYIQGSLSIACHLVAAVCWFSAVYRPLAPLMHLAALGILLDCPNQLALAMLRREMNLRRIHVLNAIATMGSLLVTATVALAGGGAYALVLGANVIRGIPFGLDLLVVRRWRPGPSWWRWPMWRAYRAPSRFGLQQASSALLYGFRGFLEVVALPGALGYSAIGVLGRAQALFTTTIGRGADIMTEAVYPLLPRYAGDSTQYARKGTLLWRSMCLFAVPGALFIAIEGTSLSRMLYGKRWIDADPLILPAVVLGLAHILFLTASSLLLGSNRLRTCFLLDLLAATTAAPAVAVVLLGGRLITYLWAVAVADAVAAFAAVACVSRQMTRGWISEVFGPPVLSSIVAAIVVVGLHGFWMTQSPIFRVLMSGCTYLGVVAVVLRVMFPMTLKILLTVVPGGERLLNWLRLLHPPLADTGR